MWAEPPGMLAEAWPGQGNRLIPWTMKLVPWSMGTWCHLCRSDGKAIFMPYISKSRWSAAIAAHCSRRRYLNAVPDPASWNCRQYRLCSGPCWPPTSCKTWGVPGVSSKAHHSHPELFSLSIAFCFQPIAINSHPLICKYSHHGGTQLSTPFPRSAAPVTLCPLFATVQLCLCVVSYPLAASAASLETTAESTAPGIHQHRAATPPLPPGTPLVPSCPSLCSAVAWESELGRSSWTTAGQGGRCCCPALPSPHSGFTLKVTSLETRRVQEGRKRESPISTSISHCWQGCETPNFGCRASWGTSTAPAPPCGPSPSRVSRFANISHHLQRPKSRAGRGQTHFSRQTCSHLKAKFSFSISDTEHSSSGPHQRPFLSNSSESGRKLPRASTVIPCLSDTGTAARDHWLLLGPNDRFRKSHRR